MPDSLRVYIAPELLGAYVLERDRQLYAVVDRLRAWATRRPYTGPRDQLVAVRGRAAVTIAVRLGARPRSDLASLVAQLELPTPTQTPTPIRPKLQLVEPTSDPVVAADRTAAQALADALRAVDLAQAQLRKALANLPDQPAGPRAQRGRPA